MPGQEQLFTPPELPVILSHFWILLGSIFCHLVIILSFLNTQLFLEYLHCNVPCQKHFSGHLTTFSSSSDLSTEVT